ncbi:FxsA family protein [Arcobacter sp. FWKO B]|uniref:FxsA family protein n=1 Tax=Arcobacter sp. FWKO B TaxID=2593672 RepID=UPI0018A65603|nr:FxsA family protein [Arcobacter sp. FWKO B]QOG11950.1 FxsA family protein [Arcobacter sp. FWKO B]
MVLIYFFIYLFAEVMITTAIAGSIGGLWTFFEIITSAIVGVMIFKNFRYSIAQNLQKLSKREINEDEFTKLNLASVIGAILLIIPGFFTDIIGLLFQISFIAKLVFSKFIVKSNNSFYSKTSYTQKQGEDNVIDVEVIEHNSSTSK